MKVWKTVVVFNFNKKLNTSVNFINQKVNQKVQSGKNIVFNFNKKLNTRVNFTNQKSKLEGSMRKEHK